MAVETRHMYVRKASAGSGKTYTLAAHYIALLLHGERFQSILAVTFTNKATAEMKERILGYLYAIGYHLSESATQAFLIRVRTIGAELGFSVDTWDDAFCQSHAQSLHATILSHYDEMRVQTIDTFLQSLLAGMVQQLDGAVGYQVELDVNKVIHQAVEELLTQGAQDPSICRALTRYIDDQLAEEKNWDIRVGLQEIGQELFKEQLQQHTQQLVLDEKQLLPLKHNVHWRKVAAQETQQMQAALDQIKHLTAADFPSYGNELMKAIGRIQSTMEGSMTDKKDAFRGLTERSIAKVPDAYAALFDKIQSLAATLRKAWLHERYITAYLNDLVLMGALLQRIQTYQTEHNTRLLAQTASTLANALQPGDADFILEKAGIRYRHIMLDEFQDTSQLQWNNFKLLLQNLLASAEGSTLIVGDIKQSIYRWRNGDWTIMRDLPKQWADAYNTNTPQLTCNFRSEKNIVQFNLETMQWLASHESEDIQALYEEGYTGDNLANYYRAGHEGGYVQVRWYTQKDPTILPDMFAAMEQLLAQGEAPSSIMVLLRTNKEAKELLEGLQEVLTHAEDYPHLAHTPFVSNNCFQLQYSATVQLLVAAMRYIYTADGVSYAYLQQVIPQVDLTAQREVLATLTLTDLVEQLITDGILAPALPVPDLSYVNAFRDMVTSYVGTNGSDGKAFLQYWEDTMCTKTIPAVEVQGIRMMTIHAAKGLEADNLFLPFCDWEIEEDKRGAKLWCEVNELKTNDGDYALLPIVQDGHTAEAGFEAPYEEEHHFQRVDNLNLLYVALTRAAQRLYIYAPVTEKSHHVGQRLAERCGMWPITTDVAQFTMGDAQWRAVSSKASADLNPFSFLQATEIESRCYSSASRIDFRQSQDSRKYGWNIVSTDTMMDQRAFGTICHDILASIGLYASVEDAQKAVEEAIDRAFERGIIPDDKVREKIQPLLVDTVTQAFTFFTGDWQVHCEEAILLRDEHGEVEERRMDRVLWSNDKKQAVVLDYKFGQDNPSYDKQVRRYMTICRRMGAQQVRGYLWIASERRLEEVSV